MDDTLTYLIIMLSSGLKFIFGPTMGVAAGLNWVITSICTACGMMLSVFVFSFFGERIKLYYQRLFPRKKQKVFTKRNRRFVKIWNQYGVPGVALLTPVLFTPIGGTLLAVALGGERMEIFKYMAISAFFWAFVITSALHFASVVFYPH